MTQPDKLFSMQEIQKQHDDVMAEMVVPRGTYQATLKQLLNTIRENERCHALLDKIAKECEDGLTTKVYEEIYAIIDNTNKESEK